MRNISVWVNILAKRSAISSHAAFDWAQTKIFLLVVRTIVSMAATTVFVLPVPGKRSEVCSFRMLKSHVAIRPI